nr:hypothetical protein [Candidatus Sigynarchaeota archaeon]
MSSTASPLKKFNELLAKEMEKANLYEKNGMWEQAKKQWLDIIEYCRLFAKKTPDLKPAMAKMIQQKADGLMERVQRTEAKISQPSAPPRKEPAPVEDEGPTVVETTPPPEESIKPKVGPFAKQQPGSDGSPAEAPKGDKKNFINVGNEHIEVPDDFPLVEITPKEGAFKPPSKPSDKVQIDKTKFPVDGEQPPASPSDSKPAKPGSNKPKA